MIDVVPSKWFLACLSYGRLKCEIESTMAKAVQQQPPLSANTGVKCNVLSLQYLNLDFSQIRWIRSSVLQDTLVAQHKDGSFSVLKIKDRGQVSSFVLDPSLKCVYWDNEDSSLHRQWLYAQASNGDVLLYAVEEDGIFEAQHLSISKIVPKIPAYQNETQETDIHLVGCDSGKIVLRIGSQYLFCAQIASSGETELSCCLPLPEPAFDSAVNPMLPICQVVNGSLVILDTAAYTMFIHSIGTGACICQLDLQPFGCNIRDLLDWRMSQDSTSLYFILKDWSLVQMNIKNYSKQFPSRVIFIDSSGQEQIFSHEYLSYNLCRYGDVSWKQEVVSQHIQPRLGPGSQIFGTSAKTLGFKTDKQRIQKESVNVSKSSVAYKTILNLGESIGPKSWSLEAFEASSDILTLVLKKLAPSSKNKKEETEESDESGKIVIFANFSSLTTDLHRLPHASSMVLSTMPACSHMLLSGKFLMFISPRRTLQKDDLISWMMSVGGPNAADSLCQANQWTRTAVPLHTLESSLQQRQLDTLAFFFKSKQGLFSTALQSKGRLMLVREVEQLEDILQLVTTHVTSSCTEQQARMFSERLLSLALEFVYGLLEDARQVMQQQKLQNVGVQNQEIKDACNVLLSHIPELHKCMDMLKFRSSQRLESQDELDATISEPEEIDPELTAEQCVKENKLSSLQASLISADEESKADFFHLVTELLESVKTSLEKEDMTSCQHILNNLGCDVTSTLWSLAQFCASRSLQQYITSQLSAAAALTPSQCQVVQYLEQLYEAYPCESFSAAMKKKVHSNDSSWPDEEDPLKAAIVANDLFLLSYCGELNQTGSSEKQTGLYASLILAWLANWSADMRRGVMMDAHFLNSGDALTALRSDPETTWQFLIAHNLSEILLPLIQTANAGADFPLPSNPTQYLHLGWSYLQKELAVELLRLEKLNLESLNQQGIDIHSAISSVGGPIHKPHPLNYTGAATVNQFHNDFLIRCVSAGLQLPLWMYCSMHGILPSEVKVTQQCSWFPIFQAMYVIPRHPSDKTLILSASLLQAAELWSFSPGEMTVEMMFEKNQILAAVGTLSYTSLEHLNLDATTIEKYLYKFPKLMAALMPAGHEISSKQNTTVYQLLMNTAPFDLRRLFGWHSTNIFAREESPKVMPHFSESKMNNLHTRNQKLAFPYYLKHGRPVYAFLSFLSEELDKKESTLSPKRIEQACGAALWIACQNFNTPYISSACVVFVELLGRDSTLVRAMINTGRLLLAHRHRNISDGAEARKEQLKTCAAQIFSELQACVRSRHHHGNKLIKSLEVAVLEEIKHEGLGNCSFEASQKWTLVILLCQLLSLPLSTCFLQSCAETNNWLMFVWYSQLHQYPTHQLQNLLHSFRSPHLRDHLHYVLNNADSKLFSAQSSTSPSVASSGHREQSNQIQRTSLYSRIGVQRAGAELSSDEEEERRGTNIISSFSARLKQSEFNESEMPESVAPDDVFRMLFHSRSMPSQWRCLLSAAVSLRNPLFAELAACCKCPAIPAMCGWLLASLNEDVKQNFLRRHGQLISKWNTEQLEALIDVTLECGQEDSLATAFAILQPKSPLLPFLCFVTECVKKGNYAACKTYIDQFKDSLAMCENKTEPENTKSDIPTIGNRVWFEKITYQVLCHELKVVSSLYHAKHLLKILDKQNMCLIFSFDVLDFALLHQVITIFHANSVPNIHLASLLTSEAGSSTFVAECETGIDYLIRCGQFSEAQDLAKVAGISRERVAISQLNEEKQRLVNCGVWTAKFVRTQFWDKCKKLMSQSQCSPEACTHFFQNEIKGTAVEFEKAFLCQHLFSLLEASSESDMVTTRDIVFREMWRHRIAAKISLEDVEPLDQIFDDVQSRPNEHGDLKLDLIQEVVSPHSGSDAHEDFSSEELSVLDDLMGSYLDKGMIRACAQVAAVFGHYNQDLSILQTCIALASEQCLVDSIEPAMKRLVLKSSSQRVRAGSINLNRSYSLSSLSSNTSVQSEASTVTDTNEVIRVMEKLFSQCVKGSQVCLRVITCYKIAQMLGVEYKNIIMNSEFDSLRKLLRVNNQQKFLVARDFLSTSGLSDDEVTGFLSDSIVDVLKLFMKGGDDAELGTGGKGQGNELILNSTDGMEVFTQFVKLCENTALLGDRILQAVASLLPTDGQDMSTTVLSIQTELIIMAHECYTISSNMEGISHVLRAARVCCDCLAEANEFSLMIRLLTGVGRYSEMLYVFHALQQNHQFELLLRKGMDREDKLKVAILDYLKRYQPDDNDAYTMVALKFSMFRDIAGMLEACGHRSLKHLKGKVLENTKETQDWLKKCLQYFQDAAESYVKDNSVRKAQHCVKMARLLSLQLQLLSNGTVVIHLSKGQVIDFVNTHPRFIEAMVVSDAYEHRTDWADAIYNIVVVCGDMRYLQEMKLHVHITPSLVEDVVKRFKQAPVKPSGGLTALRKLLPHCKDAQLQYRLATELGLTDIVTAMLKGDAGSYLQDITVV